MIVSQSLIILMAKSMPYDIEFKDDMPKTLVGKVAYRVLEEEELAKANLVK